MNREPSLPLQGALVTAIKAGNTSAGGAVYDTVPESNPFPRITLGPCQVVPFYADCMEQFECTLQIDIWTRSPGFPECKRIMGEVYNVVSDEANLLVPGYSIDTHEIVSIDYSDDPDGITKRGRMNARFVLQGE